MSDPTVADEIETLRQNLIKELGVDPAEVYGADWYEQYANN